MAEQSRRVKKNLNLQPVTLSTLTNPEAGDIACDKDDGNKIKRYDATASIWKELGSGSGGKNYIANGEGDSTTGWTDVAGTGLGSWVLSVQSGTVLRDTKSFKITKTGDCTGKWTEYKFTIDNQDKNKSLYWSMDMATDGSYVVDDIALDVQSNTQSDWLGTTSTITVRGSITNGRATFSFPTSSDLCYKIRIKANNSNTNNFNVYFDTVIVGPDKLIDQQASFENRATSISLNTENSNGSLGNGTLTASYSRHGSRMKLIFSLTVGSTTSFGTGSVIFSLPTGLTNTLNDYTGLIYLRDNDTSANRRLDGFAYYSSPGYFRVGVMAPASNPYVTATYPFTWNTGDIISGTIECTIDQWVGQSAILSTTEMMNQTASAKAYRSTNLTATTSGLEIIFDTESIDTNGLYNTSNGRFVANRKMKVRYYYQVLYSQSGASTQLDTFVSKNGVGSYSWSTLNDLTSGKAYPAIGCGEIDLLPGEYISVFSAPLGASVTIIGAVGSERTYFVVEEIPVFSVLASYGDATPEGVISAWVPGYFTNGSNAGFTNVLGSANTVAGANAYLNSRGYYVCDGSQLQHPESRIFSDSGRYLPNLTDSRFLMGSTVSGAVGGSNTLLDHTHSKGTLAITVASGAHIHTLRTGLSTGGGTGYWADYGSSSTYHDYSNQVLSTNSDHTHPNSAFSGSVGTGSAATSTNSRPLYLSVFYIMKVRS